MSERLRPPEHEIPEGPPERRDSLWLLTFAPTIWAVHFIACYVLAAVWCARAVGRDGPLGPVRIAIAALTLVALLGITWTAWRAYRQQAYGEKRSPFTVFDEAHDSDTAADRHRFLGFATLLLCGLSFASVVYVGLAVLFIGTCA